MYEYLYLYFSRKRIEYIARKGGTYESNSILEFDVEYDEGTQLDEKYTNEMDHFKDNDIKSETSIEMK